MNTAIEKRIAKLEDELLPRKLPAMRLLYEPLRDADADSWALYKADLEDARSKGEMAVVVCACYKPNREPLPGMRFFNSRWEADIDMMAGQPSQVGNKNRLDDLLKSLPGTVLGTVANPPPDVHSFRSPE